MLYAAGSRGLLIMLMRRSQGHEVSCCDFTMSAAQMEYLSERLSSLEKRCKPSGAHLMFQPRPGKGKQHASDNSRGYILIKLSIPGYSPASVILARAVYICRSARLDLLPGGDMKEWHVSHLCHQPLCIQEDHLILEPGHVNKGRQHCSPMDGCCKDHAGYPDCLFD